MQNIATKGDGGFWRASRDFSQLKAEDILAKFEALGLNGWIHKDSSDTNHVFSSILPFEARSAEDFFAKRTKTLTKLSPIFGQANVAFELEVNVGEEEIGLMTFRLKDYDDPRLLELIEAANKKVDEEEGNNLTILVTPVVEVNRCNYRSVMKQVSSRPL